MHEAILTARHDSLVHLRVRMESNSRHILIVRLEYIQWVLDLSNIPKDEVSVGAADDDLTIRCSTIKWKVSVFRLQRKLSAISIPQLYGSIFTRRQQHRLEAFLVRQNTSDIDVRELEALYLLCVLCLRSKS